MAVEGAQHECQQGAVGRGHQGRAPIVASGQTGIEFGEQVSQVSTDSDSVNRALAEITRNVNTVCDSSRGWTR
jgi:uncharacterized protein YukE